MSGPVAMPPTRGAGPAPPGRRHAARLAAVQALYQMSVTGLGAETVVREFLRHRLGERFDDPATAKADPDLFAIIVRGVAAEADVLDDMIAAVLHADLDVDRLEPLLKVILRAGTFELSTHRDVHSRVLIDEYVDIADSFYDKRRKSLANAVFDHLARGLRPEEMDESAGEQVPTAR